MELVVAQSSPDTSRSSWTEDGSGDADVSPWHAKDRATSTDLAAELEDAEGRGE